MKVRSSSPHAPDTHRPAAFRPRAARAARHRRVATAVALVAAVVLGAMNLAASPASADPLPLSPAPTAELTCSNGTSQLTIHWPAGEYGPWVFGGDVLGDISGPGGTYVTPWDEVRTVPSGWTPISSTFRLNSDPGMQNGYNQVHVHVDGASCPFQTSVGLTMDCPSRTLSTAIGAGHVSFWAIYDDITGDVIDQRFYPDYDPNTGDLIPMPVGPTTLTTTIPTGITRVRAELIVDNTPFSVTQNLACTGGCVRPLSFWSSPQTAPINRWPLTTITAGNATYTAAQAQAEIGLYSTPYFLLRMEQQLIVAKLNRAKGAMTPTLDSLIAEADTFLQAHPVGSTLTQATKNSSESLRTRLLSFNGGNAGVPPCNCGPLT